MPEVAKVIGKEGWVLGRATNRREFLDVLHRYYKYPPASYKLPGGLEGMEERLPLQGRFVIWEYQGFPSTGSFIVVFFAPPKEAPESQPCVVARGVFELGDLP